VTLLERIFGPKRTESTRLEHLESKCRVLEDQIEKNSRALKGLELEWEQVYDKMMHLMARITKRAKTLDREQNGSQSLQDGVGDVQASSPGAEGLPGLGTHGRLAEMRRRNGLLPR